MHALPGNPNYKLWPTWAEETPSAAYSTQKKFRPANLFPYTSECAPLWKIVIYHFIRVWTNGGQQATLNHSMHWSQLRQLLLTYVLTYPDEWSDKWKFIHQRNCNFHNRNFSNTFRRQRHSVRGGDIRTDISWWLKAWLCWMVGMHPSPGKGSASRPCEEELLVSSVCVIDIDRSDTMRVEDGKCFIMIGFWLLFKHFLGRGGGWWSWTCTSSALPVFLHLGSVVVASFT